MKTLRLLSLAAMLAAAAPAIAMNGQKLDSGLGELPHYSQWADKYARQAEPVRVAGESLDSGLGELPHYRHWAVKYTRTPASAQVASR